MSEILILKDSTVSRNILLSTEEGTALFLALKETFPWIIADNYRAISEPYYHEYLKETVIRTCVAVIQAETLLGRKVTTAHRLFCMDSKTSMFYTTEGPIIDEQPTWYDDANMHMLGKTIHTEEFNRPSRPEMFEFQEYFVVGNEAVLSAMNSNSIPEPEDKEWLYGVVVKDDEVITTRKYYSSYGDAQGLNWQLMYLLGCREMKRTDLAKDLYRKSFMDNI